MAIDDAMQSVQNEKISGVPNHLKDAHYKSAGKLGHGTGYKYAHDYQGHFVEQQFLPDDIRNKRIWHAQENAAEAKLQERMLHLWKDRYK